MEQPRLVVNSVAPIRICDNGGWTDTWFARHGAVFNIGVHPCAEVQVAVFEGEGGVVLHAENYGERYPVAGPPAPWGAHPLLEAAIAWMRVPRDLRLEVTIHSEAPAGAGTGTSAAVTVALVGALDRLRAGRLTPHEVAGAAQRVETEMLGRQCGIQDQLGSAYGGINYIEMSDYPRATVSAVPVPDATWWELERRLLLVYLGKSHDSSALHEQVIRGLEDAGPDHPVLRELRATAPRSRDALSAGDFPALGAAMIANTDAQARLHPALVGTEARRAIGIAREHGALGWKVNGAGGEGGSVTLLCDESSPRKRALVRAIEGADPVFRHVPTRLSRQGLRVWTSTPAAAPFSLTGEGQR
ncbi:MAG TPA: GHMP kinase [Vicinamibacteria bacterium]|nr:GHMP kinase [Vicinamibacteria bacterium]